jgi:hypothetical protein
MASMNSAAGLTIMLTLVGAATYEALPLNLLKTLDLRSVTYADSAPRVIAAQPLPNPYLSTG